MEEVMVMDDLFNAQLIQIGLPFDHPYWRWYGLILLKKENFKGWTVEYRDFSSVKQSHEFGEDEASARRFYNMKT